MGHHFLHGGLCCDVLLRVFQRLGTRVEVGVLAHSIVCILAVPVQRDCTVPSVEGSWEIKKGKKGRE